MASLGITYVLFHKTIIAVTEQQQKPHHYMLDTDNVDTKTTASFDHVNNSVDDLHTHVSTKIFAKSIHTYINHVIETAEKHYAIVKNIGNMCIHF